MSRGSFMEECRREMDRAVRSLALAELRMETGRFCGMPEPTEEAIAKRIAEIDEGAFEVRS